LFVNDANLPNVAALADVNWASRSDHISTRDCAYMIRVDFLTDDSVLLRVDHETGSDATQGLSECNGRAAVQDSKRLTRAFVDGHACAEVIIAELDEFDAELTRERLHPEVNLIERVGVEPDSGHVMEVMKVMEVMEAKAGLLTYITFITFITYITLLDHFFFNPSPTLR
jgi:hypothetical protein